MNVAVDVNVDHQDTPGVRTSRSWGLPVLAFAVLAGCIAAAGYGLSDYVVTQVRADREQSLLAVAELKARRIENWREERLADARAVAEPLFILHDIGHNSGNALRNASDNNLIRLRLEHLLQTLRATHGYRALMMFDTDAQLRLSTSADEKVDTALRAAAIATAADGRIRFMEARRADDAAGVWIDIVAPQGRAPIWGVIVLRADAERVLLPIIRSWPTTSPSAESILATREGGTVRALHSPRHRTGLPRLIPLATADPRLPVVQAAHGRTGVLSGVDYRGVEVYAVVRNIADSPWTLITKIDRQEVEGPIRQRIGQIVLAGLGLTSLVALICFWWWRQQLTRYDLLARAATLERQAVNRHYDVLNRYSNDIVLLADSDGQIVEANQRAAETYGFSRDQLLSMTVRELRDPETLAGFEREWQAPEDGGDVRFETRQRRCDGSTFPVEISGREIRVG